MAKTLKESFSQRLVKIRKAKGLTQIELATLTGISPRMIAHYETRIVNPAPDTVIRLAKALSISIDELMGHRPVKEKESGIKNRRLIKKMKSLEELPPEDQRAVVKFIDALSAKQSSRK